MWLAMVMNGAVLTVMLSDIAWLGDQTDSFTMFHCDSRKLNGI